MIMPTHRAQCASSALGRSLEHFLVDQHGVVGGGKVMRMLGKKGKWISTIPNRSKITTSWRTCQMLPTTLMESEILILEVLLVRVLRLGPSTGDTSLAWTPVGLGLGLVLDVRRREGLSSNRSLSDIRHCRGRMRRQKRRKKYHIGNQCFAPNCLQLMIRKTTLTGVISVQSLPLTMGWLRHDP